MTLQPRTEEIKLHAKRLLDARRKGLETSRRVDVCDYAEERYWVVDEDTGTPGLVRLALHQKAVLRYPFTRTAAGHFPYTTVLLSTVKKSGKTTLAAIVARWMAETQTRMGEIYFAGNDLDQAKGRSFASVSESIKLTPGAIQRAGDWVLPNKWVVLKTFMECLTTGTVLKAVAVDAKGEAGGNPNLTVWTELWGFTLPDAVKFYTEMTPVPTRRDSIRLVETYAGYDGDSTLLQDLYNTGMAGRQLTNGELASAVARDVDGERYEDFLHAFAETAGDPDALVPVWVNDQASLFCYWDEDVPARRMSWQRGERGDAYYTEEAHMLPPGEFDRLHRNLWIGAVSGFVPIEWWDACYDPDLTELEAGSDVPCVVGVDAAVTHDCFGVVMVSRYPDPELAKTTVAVRAARKWEPTPGNPIDLTQPENFLRTICRGGCVRFHPLGRDGKPSPPAEGCSACAEGLMVPRYNVKQIPYDPHQLALMMQRLTRDRVAWCEPFLQQKDRLIADSDLRTMIAERRLRHTCAPPGHPKHDPGHVLMDLRQHLTNAAAQLEAKQDSKLRIVKKAPDRKIDLVIALSMAAKRCLYLRI